MCCPPPSPPPPQTPAPAEPLASSEGRTLLRAWPGAGPTLTRLPAAGKPGLALEQSRAEAGAGDVLWLRLEPNFNHRE